MKRKGHIVDLADDHVHGLLSEDEAKYVETHCETCRICQVAIEEAVKRYEAMKAVPTVEASEDLIQRTMGRVRSTKARVRRAKRIAVYTWALATAAAVAIVGGLHIYYATLSPTPYDLQVYGQQTLLAGTQGSLRVCLFDRKADRPLPGVPVSIELCSRQDKQVYRLAGFNTDRDGTGSPRLSLPDVPDGEYELRVRAAMSGPDEVITRTVKLTRSWKLMLSTDKPVYQPGQTIHVRSLALRRPDLHPVAGQSVTFSITDPKGNVIFRQSNVSSAYGIASADCPLATEILEGAYVVACRIGDTESKVAVEVRKYVLPKFKIDVALDGSFYQPGQTVRGTVQANYFFGKPVAGGEAEVVMSTTDIGLTELARTQAPLDEAGRAEFSFRLPDSLVGREQDGGDARVTFEVAVRDTAGQEQTRSLSRTVTASPIRIEVIAESGRLVPGIANTVYVFASYADGSPAAVRLAVTGVDHEVQTSPLGAASFELTPSGQTAALTLRATDAQGLTSRRQVTLDVGQLSDDFLVRTDKAVYAGGDSLTLTALGGGVEPVFVDFIKDGQTLLTETVEMVNGRGEQQFDLPPDLFGTIEILAYRFGPTGLPVRRSRVIYVEQAGDLSVTAELDRGEYRPGEQARLVLHLADETGAPTPGAVSLAAVDEAVFSVLEQAPGMEKTFFALEEELLKPIYAIYPWSPNLETSAFDPEDRNCFQQALFSRTAKMPSGRSPQIEQLLREGRITEQELLRIEQMGVDNLAARGMLADDFARQLMDQGSPHTLVVRSHVQNAQAVSLARERGLRTIRGVWITVAIPAIGIGLVLLLASIPRVWGVLLVVVVGLPLLVYSLLPSLSRARTQGKLWISEASVGTPANRPDVLRMRRDAGIEAIGGPAEAAPTIRVREWFPETLLWRPELITDDNGRVSIDVDLADSITTWRLTGSAVAADGRLGGLNSSIRVFQPFFVDLNLPVALPRGDEVAVPVVVYNYLDEPQTVELSLDTEADWFELLDEPSKAVTLAAGDVQSTSYRIRVKTIGQHELQVTAQAGEVGDAIKRTIEVISDGRRVAEVHNGVLTAQAAIDLPVPETAIPGSVHAVLKIYPSTFSQVLEGMEGMFQRPYGCFEQTSSTTYPNVLALDYLRRTKQNAPAVEATARQYIHLGYQRLLGFEVNGGGFDWFGRPPANRTLTAYGLMEFEDMARVHDVDPNLIERTRTWLLGQRDTDGSWTPEMHKMHVEPTTGSGDAARLSTTAYIAWAVFSGQADKSLAAKTQSYLLSHRPESIADPYTLALVCNALLAMDHDGVSARPYVARLLSMRKTDATRVWWEQNAGRRTMTYATGVSGSIETTALAVLALLNTNTEPGSAKAALTWLVEQKDRMGTFHSTQATVLALKALLAGTGKPLGGDVERIVDFALNGAAPQRIIIPANQGDVVQQIDLSANLTAGGNRLQLADPAGAGLGYQVDFAYHVPDTAAQQPQEGLAIDIRYDRSELQVGDAVWADATVRNNMPLAAPMVILDLPIPAGFAVDRQCLEALVKAGTVARYQVNARSIVVYLRELPPSRPLSIRYRLDATMPVRLTVPPARAYEYYNPDNQATSEPAQLQVT